MLRSRSISLSRLGLAGCAALLMGFALRGDGARATEVKKVLTISVAPDHTEYVAQQNINLTVTIRNETREAVRIPDPDAVGPHLGYLVTGPSFPEGKVVSPYAMAQEQSGGRAAVPAPQTVALAPGESWTGDVALTMIAGQLLPGEYRIRALFEWQGGKSQSADSRIRVKPAEAISFDVGLGMRPNDRAEGRLAFLTRAGDGTSLLASLFIEGRPDIGEVRLRPPVAQFTAGAKATDIAVPWKNFPFAGEMINWTVWREGRDIKSISEAAGKPLSVTLPAEPVTIVHPPLKLKDAPVEAMVVGSDQELYLCIFPTKFDPKDPGRLAWHVRLPAAPAGIAAALAPAGNDSRHVALVAATGQGVEIHTAAWKGSGKIGAFHVARVPNVELVKTVPPALMIDDSGHARVTVIVSSRDGKSLSAVEAVFKDSGVSGEPQTVSLGAAEGPVTGGRVLYVEKAGKFQRREILLQNGSTSRRLLSTGQWRTLAPHVHPASPVVLVPGESFTYVLCFEPNRGFFFEPI